jgi:hypothetical protein
MGEAYIPVASLQSGVTLEKWIKLEGCKTGDLHVRVAF